MPPVVHRLTSYDPAEWDGTAGVFPWIPYDSREGVAAAFVAAAAGFALDAGVERMTIDNPMLEGFFSFSVRAGGWDHGLSGLFPRDLNGYHDGARVPTATALGLLRAMVLREGTWCRLRGENGFFLHVGDREDVYVGGDGPHEAAAARARALGLHAEQVERSPYDPALDEVDALPPADGAFWAEVARLVADRGGVLLEERYIAHAHRFRRLTVPADITAAREGLTPRARLAVWPDLTDDLDAVRDAVVRRKGVWLVVQQDTSGRFDTRVVAAGQGPDRARALMPGEGPGRRAGLVPLEAADRRPLLAAVLPDADGVVRARWRADRTRAEERRTFLGSLRAGDVVTGVVATGLHDIGVYVDLDDDLGRGLGFLRLPEMSWGHGWSLDDVAPVGRRIRAVVIGVDPQREQVSLSLRELQPDPLRAFAAAHRAGDTLAGTVTKLVPFGAFVRVADDVEGLVHLSDLAGHEVTSPDEVVAVGDDVLVTVLDVDLERRRVGFCLKEHAS